MSRDPAGTYTYPPGIEGVPDQTIYSNEYNSFLLDVQQDLNYPRPIVSGGTGANNARDAMINLSGEIADQVVDNYNSFPFLSGSFYSDNATGHGAPVDGHAFIGICYMKDDDNIVLEARDESDATSVGRIYVREKKIRPPATTSTWGNWETSGLATYTDGSGNVFTGISGATADMLFGLGGTPPASYFAVNTKGDGTGTNAFQVNKDGSVIFSGAVTFPVAPTFPATPPVAPTDAANKAYVDAGDAAANANANNRVLRSGDTMSGALSVPSLNSGPINCGAVVSTGTSRFVDRVLVQGGSQPSFAIYNTTAGGDVSMGMWVDARVAGSTGRLNFGNTDGDGVPYSLSMQINENGLSVLKNGFKPGGGPWADSSDARIKNVTGNYMPGLDAVTALNPVRFTFKGNDTEAAGGQSFHQDVAANGTEFVGLIAQDAEAVMPELVNQRNAYIDGVAVTDLRMIDTTPLVYALINSIKELKARLEALEG